MKIKLLNTDRIGKDHDVIPVNHKIFIWDIFDAKFINREQIQPDKPYHTVHALNLKNAEKKIHQWRVNMPLDKYVEARIKYANKKLDEFIQGKFLPIDPALIASSET